jgi:hypothetical protein
MPCRKDVPTTQPLRAGASAWVLPRRLDPQMLHNDLLPELEKLRQQASDFNSYTELISRKERTLRICLAFDYMKADKCGRGLRPLGPASPLTRSSPASSV